MCAVPGSEPEELATYFNTRNSDLIIDGLGTLLATQTRRLNEGLLAETVRNEITGDAITELNPEVTKIINSVFDRGVQLAKLVDPSLRDPKLAINVNRGGQANIIQNASPQALTAAIVSALEARGVKREEITTEMLKNVLANMAENGGDRHRAIEGTVTASRDEQIS